MDSSTNTNIESRFMFLDGVSKFVNETRGNVIMILQSLGWSEDGIKETEPYVECPFDKVHMIPKTRFGEHLTRCKTKRGICDDLPISGHYNIENMSGDDVKCIYSREDRLAMYNKDIEKVSKNEGDLPLLHVTSCTKESSMSKTYLEELALIRDLKRRRSKYKVSTKSKTYIEVIREVIKNQMDLYSDHIENEKDAYNSKPSTNIKNKSNICADKSKNGDKFKESIIHKDIKSSKFRESSIGSDKKRSTHKEGSVYKGRKMSSDERKEGRNSPLNSDSKKGCTDKRRSFLRK